MKCASCSAPLPHGSAKCPYCNCVTDVDLRGHHHYTDHVPETPRLCCICETPMSTINVHSEGEPFYIERCEKCLGLFFDPGELDALVQETVQSVYSIDALKLNGLTQLNSLDEVRYRKCPICRKLMNRINYGQASGVILDECREHGVFLDAGELRRIQEWTRAGGPVAQKARQQEELDRAEQRTRAERRELDLKPKINPYGEARPQYNETLDHSLGQVFDFLVRILK